MRAKDIIFGGEEILQATFCGTSLPNNRVCCRYNPFSTDDATTSYVRIRTPQ